MMRLLCVAGVMCAQTASAAVVLRGEVTQVRYGPVADQFADIGDPMTLTIEEWDLIPDRIDSDVGTIIEIGTETILLSMDWFPRIDMLYRGRPFGAMQVDVSIGGKFEFTDEGRPRHQYMDRWDICGVINEINEAPSAGGTVVPEPASIMVWVLVSICVVCVDIRRHFL